MNIVKRHSSVAEQRTARCLRSDWIYNFDRNAIGLYQTRTFCPLQRLLLRIDSVDLTASKIA